MPRIKRANEIIAETLGWDVSEVSECRYQRYVNPVVYAIGDRYYAVHLSKPKHQVGKEWVLNSDQFGARDTNRSIWVCHQETAHVVGKAGKTRCAFVEKDSKTRLTFQPRLFCRIQEGDLAGNWAPILPAKRDVQHSIDNYREEASRITAEGGLVSFADGGSIGLLAAIEKALAELPTSSVGS